MAGGTGEMPEAAGVLGRMTDAFFALDLFNSGVEPTG